MIPDAVKNLSLIDLYDLAVRAHSGTSFDPEKRAVSLIIEYSEELDQDLASMPEEYREKYKEKYIQVLRSWLFSKSRCYSMMITGPSNFPVHRMQKLNRFEQNKNEAFREFRRRALSGISRKERAKTIVHNVEGKENVTKEFGEIQVVTNHDIDRVQIIFPGKPAAEDIATLKKSGWNWSPTNKAWQRKLTANAQYSAERIAKQISERQ